MLEAIRGFRGYPRLREIASLVPALKPYKLNVVIRFLERSGIILIDSDGYIVWSRGEQSEMPSFSDVAELSPEFRKLFGKTNG